MEWILKTGANVFYFLTIVGGLLAGWIVFGSLTTMGTGGGPDFSAVIAVTLAVIPYCIARAFEGIRRNDYPRS